MSESKQKKTLEHLVSKNMLEEAEKMDKEIDRQVASGKYESEMDKVMKESWWERLLYRIFK